MNSLVSYTVGAHRDSSGARHRPQHDGGIPFRGPARRCEHHVHHQTLPVVHQHMTFKAQTRFFSRAFLRQTGLRVRGGHMGLIAAALTAKVHLPIAPATVSSNMVT